MICGVFIASDISWVDAVMIEVALQFPGKGADGAPREGYDWPFGTVDLTKVVGCSIIGSLREGGEGPRDP